MSMLGSVIVGILFSVCGYNVLNADNSLNANNLIALICVVVLWSIIYDKLKR